MTLTLSPDRAEMLGRTGHVWPDADEDVLLAMADGWRELHTGLDAARRDHGGSARAILAGNSGEAVSAFGQWAVGFDAALQGLAVNCARAEGQLVSFARTVYEAKQGILATIDGLARGIERAERELAAIPLVGGVLATPLEEYVAPLVAAARQRIGEILDTVTAQVIDGAVPRLVAAVEVAKGLVQDLRKLMKGESGAAWPTTPSGPPNPAHRPRGRPARPTKRDRAPENLRAIRLENEAAVTLARAGFDVEQKPAVPGDKNPDYRIEGRVFDCVSPTTANAWSLWTNIEQKKIQSGQTSRIIINIDAPDAGADVDSLRRQIQEHPIAGLLEAKVIAPGGAIIDIYP